jgi:hypothetical protein
MNVPWLVLQLADLACNVHAFRYGHKTSARMMKCSAYALHAVLSPGHSNRPLLGQVW